MRTQITTPQQIDSLPQSASSHLQILYPPGGLLIWLILLVELLTVLIGVGFFIESQHTNQAEFVTASQKLSFNIGLFNTFLLVTSGYFAAKSENLFLDGRLKEGLSNLDYALVLGCGFVAFKLFEYSQKLGSQAEDLQGVFWVYYWLFTGFHLAHVVLALILFVFVRIQILQNGADKLENLQATVVFWHLCDLIWIILFPMLYLLGGK